MRGVTFWKTSLGNRTVKNWGICFWQRPKPPNRWTPSGLEASFQLRRREWVLHSATQPPQGPSKTTSVPRQSRLPSCRWRQMCGPVGIWLRSHWRSEVRRQRLCPTNGYLPLVLRLHPGRPLILALLQTVVLVLVLVQIPTTSDQIQQATCATHCFGRGQSRTGSWFPRVWSACSRATCKVPVLEWWLGQELDLVLAPGTLDSCCPWFHGHASSPGVANRKSADSQKKSVQP